jgi:hypothetical protein
MKTTNALIDFFDGSILKPGMKWKKTKIELPDPFRAVLLYGEKSSNCALEIGALSEETWHLNGFFEDGAPRKTELNEFDYWYYLDDLLNLKEEVILCPDLVRK